MQKSGKNIVQASQPQKLHMAIGGLLLKVIGASLVPVTGRIPMLAALSQIAQQKLLGSLRCKT